MPYTNGIIYVDTSVSPHQGVSIFDIQRALGRGVKDVGLLCSDQEWYDTGTLDQQGNPVYALRRVNKINLASKFKPVRYPSVGATYESVPTLYRDADNKCGIEIPVLTASDFSSANIQSLITGSADYLYLAPRGKNTNSEWFRLRDFNGYNHNASLSFQFVPPTVSRPGYININGEYVFTLRFGNLYTKSNTVSANVLSLVDLMMRFADSNGDISVYDDSTSCTPNNPVNNGTSYGILGILCIYTSTIDGSVQVCLRSHSLDVTSPNINELEIDFTAIYDESRAPNPDVGDTVFLAPCFSNLNTGGKWVALISNTNYSQVKCALFPKVKSGSTSVDFISYTLYTPVATLAVLSYGLYGAALISGYTTSYKVSSASASFVGVTITAGTGVLGTGNTYRIANVNSAYSDAVSNMITGNLSFDTTTRQASFSIPLKDGNNNSIFISDYIPISIQILSSDGEYQNDTIQIFPYNYGQS